MSFLTGRIPFEELRATEYDAVLRGDRPDLPKQIEPWIRKLMTSVGIWTFREGLHLEIY